MYSINRSKALFFVLICFQVIGTIVGAHEVCEDNTICKNGSSCIPLEEGFDAPNNRADDGKRQYRCDCSKVSSVTRFYAGFECEYQSDDICVSGNVVSGSAFCVNGGTCKYKYGSEEEVEEPTSHEMCDCESGFEGHHCEYVSGEAPKKALNTNRSGMIVGLIVTFSVLSLLSGLFIVRMLRKKSNASVPIEIASPGEKHVKAHDVEVI